jgi:oligosaccharide repeat unit polymerase
MGILLFLILLFILLLMSVCSIFFKEKKVLFFSPVYLFSLAWTISLLIYQQGDDFLQDRTIVAILVFYLAFCIPGFLLLLRMGASAAIAPIAFPSDIQNLKYQWLFRFLILSQVISVATALSYLYFAVDFAGLGVLDLIQQPSNVSIVRGVLATENYNVPISVKLVSQLKYVNYFSPMIIMLMSSAKLVSKKYAVLSITLAIFYSICFLERSGIIRTMLTFGIFYSIYYVKNRSRFIQMIICGVLAVSFATLLVPYLRGQGDEGGTSLYNYVSGGLSGLDAFVSGYPGEVVTLESQDVYVTPGGYRFNMAPVGFETFTELFKLCNSFFGCEYKIANNKEYVYFPIMTNIYTGVRAFYQDYGQIGSSFAVAFLSVFGTVAYLAGLRRGGVWSAYFNSYLGYLALFSVLTYNLAIREIVLVTSLMLVLSLYFNARRLFFGRRHG